jgi:hypothetical protein
MHAIQILSPRPEIPFKGVSFEQLCADVRQFREIPNNWSGYSSGYYNNHSTHQQCNLKLAVTEVVDNVVSTVTGIQLPSLKICETSRSMEEQ